MRKPQSNSSRTFSVSAEGKPADPIEISLLFACLRVITLIWQRNTYLHRARSAGHFRRKPDKRFSPIHSNVIPAYPRDNDRQTWGFILFDFPFQDRQRHRRIRLFRHCFHLAKYRSHLSALKRTALSSSGRNDLSREGLDWTDVCAARQSRNVHPWIAVGPGASSTPWPNAPGGPCPE
jgi:hypothetical protein